MGLLMGVGELLDRVREQYVSQFVAAVQELGQQDGVELLSEIVLVDQDGAPVGAGALGLPLRIDLVALRGDEIADRVSVDSDKLLSFEPIKFNWPGELSVNLGPFQWDNVSFRIPKRSSCVDWVPLVGWFRQWFREEEDGNGEPLGVIHFLSDPEVASDGTLFIADLGTAPVDAFEGLLDAIAALGVNALVVGKVD